MKKKKVSVLILMSKQSTCDVCSCNSQTVKAGL